MSEEIINGVHNYTLAEQYHKPKNPVVQSHLEWFAGLKLGIMMHWAPDSQLGVVESWALSDGDREWSQHEIDWTDDINQFQTDYINANKTFNPVKFRPDKWALLAKECGFKYLLFTTKHHDGFCMFDTKTTDYKVTNSDCPFSKNPRANITKEMFDAFRAEGLAISCYFSKPDWHAHSYWCPDFGKAKTRNVNYEIAKHPALWEEFVQFTHAQITELATDYGKIDTLWLDGGWVCEGNRNQNIRLGEVVEKIRATTQPHLIACDRTVGGDYENIVTPEQSIPSQPLDIPWEACITLGKSFTFHYDEEYKSPREIVQILIEIVSKGGSLALNVTPQPDGNLPREAIYVLNKLGCWMTKHGEGIYETKISPLNSNKQIAYTQKNGKTYVFFNYGEFPVLPSRVYLPHIKNVDSIRLLRTDKQIKFTQDEDFLVLLTHDVSLMDADYADCFEITYQ